MGMINRRNAVFGWVVWRIMKSFGKQKAKDIVPGTGEYAGMNKSAIATIGAATAAALLFWRKKSDDSPSSGS
jgi:hypothetical protein